MIKAIGRYKLSILLGVIILVLCLMDTTPLPEMPMTNFDKLAHFLMFFTVSGCAFFEASHYFRRPVSSLTLLVGSLLYPLLFGGLIELLQEYLSATRAGDWMDFLYDAIGTLAGFCVCRLIQLRITN